MNDVLLSLLLMSLMSWGSCSLSFDDPLVGSSRFLQDDDYDGLVLSSFFDD